MIDRRNPGPVATPATAGTGVARLTLWHKLVGSAPAGQQRALLELARQQGVLYSHQVPANGNGNGTPADSGRRMLATVLEDGLEPVRPGSFQPIDNALDEAQRDAVARALATPDVCLIQGLPGTGKSRCVAELVLQSARLGQRSLLAALNPGALDGVLEQVANHESIFAVRCLEPNEKIDALPALVQPLAVDRRLRGLREDGAAGLRQELEALQAGVSRCQHQCERLACCQRVVEADEERARQRAELSKQNETVSSAVEQWVRQVEAAQDQAGLLSAALEARRQARARLEPSLLAVRRQQAERRTARERLEAERAPLQVQADALRSGRWWTPGWWRARFADLSKLPDLDRKQQQIDVELAGLATEESRWLQEQQRAEDAYQSVRQACCETETRRRQSESTSRLDELEAQERRQSEEWEALRTQLDPPPAREASAVRLAREACERERQQQEARAAMCREWLDCLSQHGASLAGWLAGSVNLVAMPLAVLGTDPHFGEAARPGDVFDLAIVEESQRLTEADFIKLARRARRVVLVADSEPEAEPRAAAPSRSEGKVQGPAPTLFQRLWQRLHSDPRRLPYAWLPENGGLCCRLRSCPPEQRCYLESERLDDFPEIELRILTPPRAPPALAEVVFPSTMSIVQAKEYIYRELQELPVHGLGHSFRWHEEADRVVLRLSDNPLTAPLAVQLETGIREMVVASAATCWLEFDKQAGWDRPRAEEWVRQHLGVRELGRTVRLDHSYRMEAELAAVVADLLFAGGYRNGSAAGNGNGAGPAVQFVAVPPAPPVEKPAPGRKIASRGRLARNGAGLELDLADPRQRSRLPAELREALPSHGVVNYFEAQAVIRKLVTFTKNGAAQASIGVLALYPAQAALIRALAQQSAVLRGLNLVIGTPEVFRQRESAVVLVSLTRSHTNRAVPYGDGPSQLSVALTRARHQLILFGDPGTLARRCQWDKAVDHLDEPAAARERAVVTRLCDYLQGKGTHARAFHLDEGIGP